MKFKVGDRVRVIDNDEECFGLVGKIESKSIDFMGATYYIVDIGKELPYAFWENQLEIYVEEEGFIAFDNKNQQSRVLTKEQFKLEELEERIEKLEKCVIGEQNLLEKCENVSNFEKMTPKLGIKDFKDMIRPNKIVLNTNDPLEMIWDSTKEESKPSLLTEDERVILRNIDKKYEWITKDIDGDLYVFEECPYKCENNYWRSRNEFDGDYIGIFFNHIFKSLTTEKPYNIEELLKGESNNE